MAPADLIDVAIALLRLHAVRVIERPAWRTRGRPYGFSPVGVMNHHDALNNAVTTDRGLAIIEGGRPDLPGPLANFWAEDDGTIYVVAGGNCNHAGMGSAVVLDRVKRDVPPGGDAAALGLSSTIVGNPWFFGIEVHNAGDGRDPYEGPQLDALLKLNASLCIAGGWSQNRCVHHREWTARKPDMSWRGPLRDNVALHMLTMTGAPPAPAAPPPPPPPFRVVRDWQEDPLQRIELVIPLDDQGRGWRRLDGTSGTPDVPFGRLVSVRPQGSAPGRDKAYWPLVETGEQDDGGVTLLTVEGGTPGGQARVWLHVAA